MIKGRVCKNEIDYVRKNFLFVDGVYVDLDTVLFREYEINNEKFRVIFFMGVEQEALVSMQSLMNDEDYICLLSQYLEERENRYKFNEIIKAKKI